MDYKKTYSEMSNDDVLNVAIDPTALQEEARVALADELNRRRLSESDIIEYRHHLALIKPGEFPGKEKFVARSFNGFGTSIYGKGDFWPDGSFITTTWLIFFWIPIVPLSSMRVKKVPSDRGASSPFSIWSTNYLVYSKRRPVLKQVAYVYVYVFLVASAWSWWTFEHTFDVLHAIPICLLLVIPWFFRMVAKSRATHLQDL
jgi:hypothetical protein